MRRGRFLTVTPRTPPPHTPQLGIEKARLRARQRWRIRYDGRLRVRVDLPQDALEPLGASRLGKWVRRQSPHAEGGRFSIFFGKIRQGALSWNMATRRSEGESG